MAIRVSTPWTGMTPLFRCLASNREGLGCALPSHPPQGSLRSSDPLREGQWASRNGRVPDLAGNRPSTKKGIVTGWVGDHLDGHLVLPHRPAHGPVLPDYRASSYDWSQSDIGAVCVPEGVPASCPSVSARFTHFHSEGSPLLPTSYRHRFTPNALRAAKRSIPDHERESILHGVSNLHVGMDFHYPEDPPVPALTLRVLSISQDGSVLLGLPEDSIGMS